MSLINDMLKDLDNDTAKDSDSLPTGLQATEAKRRSRRGWILPALAAVAALYALVVEFNILGLMPDKSAPAEIPQPVALNSKWLEQGPATKAAEPVPLDKVTPDTAPVAAEPVVESRVAVQESPAVHEIQAQEIPAQEIPIQESLDSTVRPAAVSDMVQSADMAAATADSAVARLLQAAASALQEQRLTTPVGNNAYQYFNSVLLLEPENPQAVAGIQQIQQIYLDWLDQALTRNQPESARRYWHKARAIGADEEVLLAYENRLQTLALDSGAPQPMETKQIVTQPVATEESATQQTPAKYSISAAAAPSVDDASAAARLIRDGLTLGEARAWRWLEQGAAVEQTGVVLADFYAAQGAQPKLARLHELLSRRGSTSAVYIQAQLMAGQQNFTLAAEQLSGVEFSGAAEERRLRTLAGFYQRLRDYARALPLYSHLVNTSSANANDWLGLAVSADAQQMTAVAQNAYQMLLRLNHPDPRVMGFARQRQQDLSFSSSR